MKIQNIILLFTLTLAILITLFGRSVYLPPLLQKPQINIISELNDQSTSIVYIQGINCKITPLETSSVLPIKSEYEFDYKSKFSNIKYERLTLRFGPDKGGNKMFWDEVNPNFLKLRINQDKEENIRCFETELDATVIPGNKYTKIKNIDGQIKMIN